MAISGIGSNDNNVYGSTYAAQKNEGKKKAETKEATSAQAGKPQNAKENAVSDYYSYLQKNYGCMSKGNVTISSEYLKKCSGDSKKAKELEDFLKKIPELEKQGYEQLSAQNKALGGTVTYYQQTWMVNKDGSIQSTVYSVTETGMTNAERMKKSMDERLEKQKEKKEEEEKVKEKKEKAMKDIRSQYGDAVIVEFSGDGMAALLEGKKGGMAPGNQEAMVARNAAFQKDIVQIDKSLSDLPAYSGMYGADKAVASALENCSKEEQGFVYDIIRQNFLVGNSGFMTEEERQANISLGMKKAEYATQNFIPEDSREAFLKAMESIAKLASAGTADSSGNMDYGVAKGRYLGHGSNLVQTTNALDMMRTMDKDAYAKYQKMGKNDDGGLSSLKYLTNWYAGAVKKNSSMVDNYEKQSEEYVEKNVKDRKLDTTFVVLKTGSKAVFFESLKMFQSNHPNFLSSIINRELTSKFWEF